MTIYAKYHKIRIRHGTQQCEVRTIDGALSLNRRSPRDRRNSVKSSAVPVKNDLSISQQVRHVNESVRSPAGVKRLSSFRPLIDTARHWLASRVNRLACHAGGAKCPCKNAIDTHARLPAGRPCPSHTTATTLSVIGSDVSVARSVLSIQL